MLATSPSRSEALPAALEAPQSTRPTWHEQPPRWHGVAEACIKAAALLSGLAIVLIFVFIAREALPLLTSSAVRAEVTPSSMWLPQTWGEGAARFAWQPASDVPKYSLAPLLLGSLKITLVALVVGGPLGVLSAIYTSQIAPRWLREVLKPTIELLAGIPSVVVGVFSLLVMATWGQRLFGFEHRLNAVVAGVALSVTVIPLVFTLAEEALSSVPRSLHDASLALGATHLHTVWHVVVPAAMPGIAAGVVLGFGRALGETMIVVMASGNAAIVSASFGQSARTLTATIAQEMAEVVHGSPHYAVLFTLGATLLLFSFATNAVAQHIVEGYRQRRGGS